MSNPVRIKTPEELADVLKDGNPHEFKCILMPGLFSRRTVKQCKNGKLKVTNHVNMPPVTSFMTMEEFCYPHTTVGKMMAIGNFVLDDSQS